MQPSQFNFITFPSVGAVITQILTKLDKSKSLLKSPASFNVLKAPLV